MAQDPYTGFYSPREPRHRCTHCGRQFYNPDTLARGRKTFGQDICTMCVDTFYESNGENPFMHESPINPKGLDTITSNKTMAKFDIFECELCNVECPTLDMQTAIKAEYDIEVCGRCTKYHQSGVAALCHNKKKEIDYEKTKKYLSFETPIENHKEEKTMFNNMDKLFGGSIGQDKGDQFKMSIMGLAIKTNEGSYAIYNGSEMVDVMDMIIPGFDNGIFKMPVTSVDKGDLIVQGSEVFYVRKVNEDNSISALNPISNKIETLMPSGNLFGFKFFIKVFSFFEGMFNSAQSKENPLAAIQPMIMMQMFTGGSLFGGESDTKKSSMGNMMEMFMMMQMFGSMGGGKASNPFEQMFSGFAPKNQNQQTVVIPDGVKTVNETSANDQSE